MPKYSAEQPYYFRDKSIDELLGDIEDTISSAREMGRQMDDGKAFAKNSIAIRKHLVEAMHLCHGLRKEVIARKKIIQARRRENKK
jgi:hypothetical protein